MPRNGPKSENFSFKGTYNISQYVTKQIRIEIAALKIVFFFKKG